MTTEASTNTLPSYAPLLRAYHEAFAKELQSMLEGLPICSGDRVLDAGCGEGNYTRWIAPLVAPKGSVVGIDLSQAYLAEAENKVRDASHPECISFRQGDIRRLPFPDGSFDLVWCAQNLFSFPEPLGAIKEMARVTRARGIVAILEDDTLHQVLLPWPIAAELVFRKAEWVALSQAHQDGERFYIARDLRRLLKQQGLKPQRRKTYVLHREYPVGNPERQFLDLYLEDLKERTQPNLTQKDRDQWIPLLTKGDAKYLPDQEDFSVTCLDHVLWAKKP